MVFPATLFFFLGGDDMPDYWASLGGINTIVASTAVLTLIPVIHEPQLVEGDVLSVHTEDDSTSYKNTSGNTAYVSLSIVCSGGGSATRHVKIWSSPNDNSVTSATLRYEVGSADSLANFDADGNSISFSTIKILNNHYIVIQNVDDSRAGTNGFLINNSKMFTVSEFTNI